MSIFVVFVFLVNSTQAQNTGDVFPPTVNERHKPLQYRAAIDPDKSQYKLGFAQHLHYQHAINDDFMWLILGQTGKIDDSDIDVDFIGAEGFSIFGGLFFGLSESAPDLDARVWITRSF